jgi:hypothetical protein
MPVTILFLILHYQQASDMASHVRPRQTMFIDVNAALKNLITLVNEKLYYYPVTQRKVLTLLNSEESPPSASTGQYNLTVVDTKDQLSVH